MRGAKVSWNALDFWMGVGLQSNRAGTHGHVVLGQANCIFAATILNADGFAGVGSAVAGLCSRAVAIGQTFNFATTFRSGRIASVKASGWASAFGGVIIRHANGSRSTSNCRADGDASANSVAVRLTNFNFATLGIRLALIFGHGAATVTVVGVTGETGPADALADVIGGLAIRVGGASITDTDSRTFPHSQNVLTTDGIGFTVGVGNAIRKSWFFASSGGRISDKVGQTFAMGFAGLDDAGFALGAGEGLARIDADTETVNVFTANGIARTFVISSALVFGRFLLASDVGIALESVATDTRRPVSVGHANGVGSALLTGAGVHATTDSAVLDGMIDGKANLATGAVEIVATRWNGTHTASAGSVAGKTETLTVPACRIRPTSDGCAWVDDIRLDRWRLADGHAHHERISRESFLALTVVASGCVQTNGIGSAGVTDTFVYIFAGDVGIALIANWANAVDTVDSLATFGVEAAFGGVAALLLGTARLVRIARCSGIANAAVGLAVFAVGVLAAGWLADGRNDGRYAEEIGFADKVRQADALVGGFVATGSYAASDAFAALLTASRDADLRLLTRQRGRTNVRGAGTTRERISVVTV